MSPCGGTRRTAGPVRPLCLAGSLISVVLAIVVGLPASGSAGDSAVERLKRGESLSCESAYRVFCANIHVFCAGHSEIRARDLSIAVEDGIAALTPTEPRDGDGVAPRSGPATFDEDAGYLLVRFEPEKGYFKVEADGRYSHRIYRRGRALMARGTCK